MLNAKSTERRGALRVLLVGENEGRRGEVRKALAALSDPQLEIFDTSARAAAGQNGGAPADVEMALVDGATEELMLSYLEAQAARSPRPVLFALLPERAASLMRRVLRAGADELLFLPLDLGDATRALLKISEARRKAERQSGGIVCSVVSTVGGVGTTTLAANLALASKHSLQKRAAVVDLHLQGGGMAVFLNLEPSRSLMELADPEKKLDSIQLEAALTKHPSGIYLLAAPKRIEDSELISDATVGATVELMRQLFDFVVVDCGSHISAGTVAAWERSDRLFYVVDQSIRSARAAWRFIELFGRLGLGAQVEPMFVLNRFTTQHPISDEQIANTLARPIFAKVPRDDRVMERALLRGEDLWQVAPNSPIARAVEELALKIFSTGTDEQQAEGGGFFGKLKLALGGARA